MQDNSTALFVLGYKPRKFVAAFIWFILSVAGLIIFVRLTYLYPVPHSGNNATDLFLGSIYLGLNIEGVLSVFSVIVILSLLVSFMFFLIGAIGYFLTGQLYLFDE